MVESKLVAILKFSLLNNLYDQKILKEKVKNFLRFKGIHDEK